MAETITVRHAADTKNKRRYEGRSADADFTVYTPKGTELSKSESFTITLGTPEGE